MMNLRADENANQYDTEHYLSVRGLGELAQGQQVKVNLGESILSSTKWPTPTCFFKTGCGIRKLSGFSSCMVTPLTKT